VAIEVQPCLVCKIILQRTEFTTIHGFTKPMKYITHPPRPVCVLKFCTTVNVYCFKRSNFAAAYKNFFDISVSRDKRRKDFLGDALNHSPILSVFFFRERCRVVFNNEPHCSKLILEIYSVADGRYVLVTAHCRY
jgi:hypothetical protein